MLHKAWSSIEEVPYGFSRSSVKFQGHIALKIVEFDPNWAFPDCNSSLNSPMAMKCCTKLETAKKRCAVVFQCRPSNLKVKRDRTSPILTQMGRLRTIGRSQLSNPSDLPCSKQNNLGKCHIPCPQTSMEFQEKCQTSTSSIQTNYEPDVSTISVNSKYCLLPRHLPAQGWSRLGIMDLIQNFYFNSF